MVLSVRDNDVDVTDKDDEARTEVYELEDGEIPEAGAPTASLSCWNVKMSE